jgi:hypothetical protein
MDLPMPLKFRRIVSQYHDRAIDSMRLAIEHFNRPYNDGRPEAVLHFALHAHEMLAKAILLNRNRRIQERRASKTVSLGTALNLLDSFGENVLDEANKVSLIALSNVRDAAQHSVVLLSEQELYLHAQTAVTVFDLLLSSEFGQTRGLPASTGSPRVDRGARVP